MRKDVLSTSSNKMNLFSHIRVLFITLNEVSLICLEMLFFRFSISCLLFALFLIFTETKREQPPEMSDRFLNKTAFLLKKAR